MTLLDLIDDDVLESGAGRVDRGSVQDDEGVEDITFEDLTGESVEL